ncbi:YebC/PmpR family DNA-binding transcriptional regulator, partial [Chroococcidiopsis cubana CCALA 043]
METTIESDNSHKFSNFRQSVTIEAIMAGHSKWANIKRQKARGDA